jgi:hypothetical protein
MENGLGAGGEGEGVGVGVKRCNKKAAAAIERRDNQSKRPAARAREPAKARAKSTRRPSALCPCSPSLRFARARPDTAAAQQSRHPLRTWARGRRARHGTWVQANRLVAMIHCGRHHLSGEEQGTAIHRNSTQQTGQHSTAQNKDSRTTARQANCTTAGCPFQPSARAVWSSSLSCLAACLAGSTHTGRFLSAPGLAGPRVENASQTSSQFARPLSCAGRLCLLLRILHASSHPPAHPLRSLGTPLGILCPFHLGGSARRPPPCFASLTHARLQAVGGRQ